MGILSACKCFLTPCGPFRTMFASLCCNKKCRRFLLVTVAVYFLTFGVVLPLLCHDLPLTKYYGLWRKSSMDTLRKAKDINRVNADNAEKRLSSLPKEATKKMYEESMKKNKLRFVIAVQTISRSRSAPPRYLTQVMVVLNDVLQESGGLDETALFICNTQRHSASEHKEAIALSEYFPIVHTSLDPELDRYEREKQDYLFCLSEAQKLSSEYVILLQDDALPHSDFYSVLDYVLKHKIETQLRQGVLRPVQDEWVWLKLNFPNCLAKYERNYYFAFEWVAISLIGATVFVLIVSCRQFRTNTNEKAVVVLPLFLVGLTYCMLLTWLLGRPYITFPRTLSSYFYRLGPGTSCCLPAVLFPQNQVPGIIQFLEASKLDKKTPLDFALDNYRAQSKLRQFLINPNLFSHIGVVSALHHGHSNTKEAENYLFVVNYMKTPFFKWSVQD